MKKISVKSSERIEFIDITSKVNELIEKAGIEEGICYLYVPHTTAAVTINESADPDVVKDIAGQLKELVPSSKNYRHREGNADSHIKSSLMGSSVLVFVENGQLKLGTWQGIFFCDFDGPRTRRVWVKVRK